MAVDLNNSILREAQPPDSQKDSGIPPSPTASIASSILSLEHSPSAALAESTEDVYDLTNIVSTMSEQGLKDTDGPTDDSLDPTISTAKSLTYLAISCLQLGRGSSLKNEAVKTSDTTEYAKSQSKIAKASGELLTVISDAATKILTTLPSENGFDLALKCLGISSVVGLSGSAAALLAVSSINIYETQQAYKYVGNDLDPKTAKQSIAILQQALTFLDKDNKEYIEKICTSPSIASKLTNFLHERHFKATYSEAGLALLRNPSKQFIDEYIRANPGIVSTAIPEEIKQLIPSSWMSFLDTLSDQDKQLYQSRLLQILLSKFESVKTHAKESKARVFDRTFGQNVRVDLEKIAKQTNVDNSHLEATVTKAQANLKKHLLLSVFKFLTSILFSASVVLLHLTAFPVIALTENILNLAIPVIFLLTELYKNSHAIKKKLHAAIDTIKNISSHLCNFMREGGKLEKILTFTKDSLKTLMSIFTLLISVVVLVVTKNCSSLAATIGLGVAIVLSTGFLIYNYMEHENKRPHTAPTNT